MDWVIKNEGTVLGNGINDASIFPENKMSGWSVGIESPRALLKEQRKDTFRDIIEFTKMSFELVSEIIDTADIIFLESKKSWLRFILSC